LPLAQEVALKARQFVIARDLLRFKNANMQHILVSIELHLAAPRSGLQECTFRQKKRY